MVATAPQDLAISHGASIQPPAKQAPAKKTAKINSKKSSKNPSRLLHQKSIRNSLASSTSSLDRINDKNLHDGSNWHEDISDRENKFIHHDNKVFFEVYKELESLQKTHERLRRLQVYVARRKLNLASNEIGVGMILLVALLQGLFTGNWQLIGAFTGMSLHNTEALSKYLASIYKRLEYNDKGTIQASMGFRSQGILGLAMRTKELFSGHFYARDKVGFNQALGYDLYESRARNLLHHFNMWVKKGPAEWPLSIIYCGWIAIQHLILPNKNRNHHVKIPFPWLTSNADSGGVPISREEHRELYGPDISDNRSALRARRKTAAKYEQEINSFITQNPEIYKNAINNDMKSKGAQHLASLASAYLIELKKVNKSKTSEINGAFSILKDKYYGVLDVTDEVQFQRQHEDEDHPAGYIEDGIAAPILDFMDSSKIIKMVREFNPFSNMNDRDHRQLNKSKEIFESVKNQFSSRKITTPEEKTKRTNVYRTPL